MDADRQNVRIAWTQGLGWLEDLRVTHVGPDVPAALADAPVVSDMRVEPDPIERAGAHIADVCVEPRPRDVGQRAHADTPHGKDRGSVAMIRDRRVRRRIGVSKPERAAFELQSYGAPERDLDRDAALASGPVFRPLRIADRVCAT